MAYTPNPLYYTEPTPEEAAPAPAPAADSSYTPNPLYYDSAPIEPVQAEPTGEAAAPVQDAPAAQPVAPQGNGGYTDLYASARSAPAPVAQEPSTTSSVPVEGAQPSDTSDPAYKAPLTAPSRTAVPHDPFSWVQNARDQFSRAENPLEVAGALLDLQSAPSKSTRDRYGQYGRDIALGGVGTETLGTSNPLDIIAHPETASNVLYQAGFDALTMSGDYAQFMRDNADRLNALYEETGDVGVYYDEYLKERQATLETGGISGALRGMGQTMLGDPTIIPSLALNAGVGLGAKALQAAGHVGLARGVVGAANIANAGVDITDPIVGGVAGAVTRAVGRSTRTSNRIGAERFAEAAGSAQQALVANQGVNAPPPMGSAATYAPAPAPTPALPAGGTATGAVAGGTTSLPPGTTPIPLGPPARPAPPVVGAPGAVPPPTASTAPSAAGASPATPGPATSPSTTPPAPPSAPASPPPPTPSSPPSRFSPVPSTPNDIMMMPRADGRGFDYVWDDGNFTPLNEQDFLRAIPDMIKVDPVDLHPTQGGPGDNYWTKMRSAMTANGFMVDDWPKNKQAYFAGDPQLPAKREAYRQWFNFTRARVEKFGEREVQRLADNLEMANTRRHDFGDGNAARDPQNRVDALYEVLKAANFQRPVEIHVGRYAAPYTPASITGDGSASPIRGRTYGVLAANEAPDAGVVPLGTYAPNGSFHLSTPPPPTVIRSADNSFLKDADRDTFVRMLHDPDGFGVTSAEAEALMASGAISPERGQQILDYNRLRRSLYRKPAPDGQRVWAKEGNARYNEAYDLWKQLGGAQPKSRAFNDFDPDEGIVEPSLAPLSRRMQDKRTGATGDEFTPTHVVGANPAIDALIQGGINAKYAQVDWNVLSSQFNAQLRRMGLGDVKLQPVSKLTTAKGAQYHGLHLGDQKLIALSAAPPEFWSSLSDMPEEFIRYIFNHETMHAVRAAGFLRTDEWQVLVNAAKNTVHMQGASPFRGLGGRKQSIYTVMKSRYQRQGMYEGVANPEDKFEEEAVAELFAQYLAGKQIPREANTIFIRMVELIKKVGQALRGTDAGRIMDDLYSGQIGKRGRQATGTVSEIEQLSGSFNRGHAPAPFLASTFNRSDLERMALDAADDTEFDGVPIGVGTRAVLKMADNHHLSDWKGGKVTAWELIKDVQHDLDVAKDLIRQRNSGWAGHNPKSRKAGERELNRILREYGDDIDEPLDALDGDAMTRAVVNKATAVWAKGLPDDGNGALHRGISGEIRGAMRNAVNFRRVAGLTNLAAGPRQIFTQYFGNGVAFLLAKPSSAFQYVSPRTYAQVVRAGDDAANVGTDFANEMRDFGMGRNLGIWNHRNALAGHETEVSGLLGNILNIVAPKWLRNLVGAPDVMARDIAARTTFRSGIQRELRELAPRSRALANQYATTRSGNFGYVTRVIEQDMPGIVERLRKPGQSYARFNGSQLEQAILDHFTPQVRTGVVDRDVLISYAKRMARDWNTVVNTEYQKAAKEVNRVFFSWDNNRIDDVVQNIFLYHYWATRASGLYAKEFAKKPWMAAGFIGLGKQLQAEAEAGDYPEWMKGWTRILNTPAGTSLWMNPMDLLYTAFLHAEWGAMQNGTDPTQELTAIGRVRDNGLIPFAWNPLLEYGLWVFNGFGQDAYAPTNMTGLDKLTSLGAQVMNGLLYAGMLPEGMGKDANGNPVPFAPRPITDFLAGLGAHFGQYAPSPFGSFETNKKAILVENIAREQPGISIHDAIAEANRLIEEAERGPADPMLIEAERDALSVATAGPEMPFLPEQLRPIFGQAARIVSPFRMYGKSTSAALIQNPELTNVLPGSPEALSLTMPASDLYERKDLKGALYDTTVAAELEQADNAWWDGGNPELAKLSTDYWAIVNGEMDKVKIGSRTYTGESLEARKEGDYYYDLANEWLASKGYTEGDIKALQEERDRIEAENPLFAEFKAYEDYVGEYPGGPEAFVDAAVKSSPAFAEFMREVPYPPGTPEYYGAVDWHDAFLAIRGDRASVYSPLSPPETGSIPGIGNGGLAAYQLASQQIAAAQSGGQSGFDEFKATIEDEVANIARAQEVINRVYPGSGLVVGQWFERGVYDTLKAEWEAEGIYVPSMKDSPVAYEYFDWLKNNATTTDGSVEAYLEQREYAGKGKDPTLPTPTEIGDIFGFGVVEGDPATNPGSGSVSHANVAVQSRDALPLLTGPSPNNPSVMSVPPGLRMELIQQQDGYAYVRIPFPAPNGTTGWVPESYLHVVQ